jgi:hypothetical protein
VGCETPSHGRRRPELPASVGGGPKIPPRPRPRRAATATFPLPHRWGSRAGEATIRVAAQIRRARFQTRGGVLGSESPERWWPVWWPVGGSNAVVASRRRAPSFVFFFFCSVCRASQLRRMANDIARHLHGMLDAVSIGPPSVSFFLPCAGRGARQRLLTVRFLGRRTTKGLYHAKICRVPFVVRFHF